MSPKSTAEELQPDCIHSSWNLAKILGQVSLFLKEENCHRIINIIILNGLWHDWTINRWTWKEVNREHKGRQTYTIISLTNPNSRNISAGLVSCKEKSQIISPSSTVIILKKEWLFVVHKPILLSPLVDRFLQVLVLIRNPTKLARPDKMLK